MNILKQFYLEGVKAASMGLGLDAEAFVQFAHDDTTEDVQNGAQIPADKPGASTGVNWSGRSSLESGDTGTRNEQMGLPRSAGV